MITIYRKDGKLMLKIEHGMLGDGAALILEWDAGRDILAEALVFQVAEHFRERVKAVRRLEYEAGWKDAKGKKRAKRDWFRSGLERKAL